jgi:hypothetical protein
MVVCKVHPEKDDPDCTRMTIGGNCICFPGNVGTNTASLKLVKLLLNSVLSCPGAWFSSNNLKNFYLYTPMPDPEFVRIKIADILAELIEEYNLQGRNCDGWIYFEICQGCYGLPQALAFLPTISSDSTFLLSDIMRPTPPQASGATNGILSNSVS